MGARWVCIAAWWRLSVSLVIAGSGTALLAACGNAQRGAEVTIPAGPSMPAAAPSAPASAPGSVPGSAVVIRVHLGQTRVAAGQPIYGQALVTNTTGKPVPVHACSTGRWVLVGLTNGTTPYDPFIAYRACGPSWLAPGAHRYPVTVMTTYQWCLGPGGKSPLIRVPKCLPDGGPPPLPAGTYITKIVADGLPDGITEAPPVTVALLPASGSR